MTWVRHLTETCGKKRVRIILCWQVLPGITYRHQVAVSKLWYGLS